MTDIKLNCPAFKKGAQVQTADVADSAINASKIAAGCITMAKINTATFTGTITTAGTAQAFAHGLGTTPTDAHIVKCSKATFITSYSDATTCMVDAVANGATFTARVTA